MLPLLVPAIRLDKDPVAEAARALERARAPWVAGFLLFGGEAEAVADLTRRLRETAGRPLLVASDMERGAGQQVRGLSTFPELGAFGLAATPADVEALGRITAQEALGVGVDVVFAPVLDVRSEVSNPIVGNRAFGFDPARVAALGLHYARGVLAGGAVPVAKHYPGHGATTSDSHDAVPVVRAPRKVLEARDLHPFRVALAEDLCPAVMTAHVAYPGLDPSGVIATFSRPMIDDLRAHAGDPDDVAVFTDALLMEGACAGIGETEAARRALRAGCDLLLYPEDPEAVAAGLEGARGEDGRAQEAAAGRVAALLGRIALARGAAAPACAAGAAGALADRVAERAVELSWSGAPERDWVLVLDDDDLEARGRVLAEAGRQAGVPVGVVRLPRGERPPARCPVAGGWTVVVMASIRAWKGAGGVSPRAREVVDGLRRSAAREGHRLRFVWLGPWPDGPGVHVPATGPAVEAALAARLLGSAPERAPPGESGARAAG